MVISMKFDRLIDDMKTLSSKENPYKLSLGVRDSLEFLLKVHMNENWLLAL